MKKILAGILSSVLLLSGVSVTLAAEYFPSVEQKGAPELGEVTAEVKTETGSETKNGVALLVDDKDRDMVVEVLTMEDILITPASETYTTTNEAARESLIQADQELKSGDAYRDVAVELGKRAEVIDPLATVNSFVVRDLFDIQLINSDIRQDDDSIFYNDQVVDLVVNFKLNLATEEPTPTVIYRPDDNEHWEILPEENVVRNADGSITVTFDRVCAIAFLTITEDSINRGGDVHSPQTGVDELALLKMATVAVCVLGAVVSAVVILKKKHA